jgi:hypothetical protein
MADTAAAEAVAVGGGSGGARVLGFGRGEPGDGASEQRELWWNGLKAAGRRDISVLTCIHLRVGPYTRRVADPQVGDRDTLGRVFGKAAP